MAVLLQGKRVTKPSGQGLRPAHLRGPPGPEVLQWHRQLPAGGDPVPAEDPPLREGARGPGGAAAAQAEPGADPEPEGQGEAAEPRPAGTVSLGAPGSGPAGGQRLRAGARGGGLRCLPSVAAVLRRAWHELPAGPAGPDHLVPGGSWTPGTQRRQVPQEEIQGSAAGA